MPIIVDHMPYFARSPYSFVGMNAEIVNTASMIASGESLRLKKTAGIGMVVIH